MLGPRRAGRSPIRRRAPLPARDFRRLQDAGGSASSQTPKTTSTTANVSSDTVMVAPSEQVVPAADGEGRNRDRLFGEEQRQDSIPAEGEYTTQAR